MKSHRPLSSLAASVAATVALLASAGCGGGKPESPKTYAYVAVFDPQTVASSVAQFQVRSDGLLQPLSPATVPAGNSYHGAVSITCR